MRYHYKSVTVNIRTPSNLLSLILFVKGKEHNFIERFSFPPIFRFPFFPHTLFSSPAFSRPFCLKAARESAKV